MRARPLISKSMIRPVNRGLEEPASARADRVFLLGLMTPMLMRVLDTSMLSVALPTIRQMFGIPSDVMGWVVTAYFLPSIMFMPLYGRLGDEFGKRGIFLAGIGVFLGGAVLTLCANDLWMLIAGRVVQGIGAAGVIPFCIALIAEHYPAHEQGRALGTWNSMGPIATIVGPFLAGFLIDQIGWRAILGPVVVVGVAAFLAVRSQIPSIQRGLLQSARSHSFDWGGAILLSCAIVLLTFYASSRPITGVDALQDWRLLLAALVLFGGLVLWERRHRNPFVALNILTNRNFSLASLGSGIRMFTMEGIGFLMPLYLNDIYASNASVVGSLVTLHAIALLITMRMGGQLTDRWGSRWPVLIGLSVQAGTMGYFALLPGTCPLGVVSVGLIAHGLGAGLSLAALHQVSLSKIAPDQRSMAASLYSMIRFSGTVYGAALGGVVLEYGLIRSPSTIAAYHFVFRFVAAVAVLGVVCGWAIRERS